MKLIFILLFFVCSCYVHKCMTHKTTILSWDCANTKYTGEPINARKIQECSMKTEKNIQIQEANGTLLQLKKFQTLDIFSCKIIIRTTLFKCGVLSHNFLLPGGSSSEFYKTNHSECHKIVTEGSFKIGSTTLENIPKNTLYYTQTEIQGRLTKGGTCYGMDFNYLGRAYTNSVQTASFEILAMTNNIQYNAQNNKLELEGAEHCSINEPFCLSLQWGIIFYDFSGEKNCAPDNYITLYNGPAKHIKTYNESDIDSVIFISSTINIRITLGKQIFICGEIGFMTNKKQLLFVFKEKVDLTEQEIILDNNLDTILYHDLKLEFLQHNLETNLKNWYIINQFNQCELEKEILDLRLRNLKQNKFLYRHFITNLPGFITIAAGEVIYISTCTMAEVEVRNTDTCNTNLPITYNGEKLFLDTLDGVITPISDEVPCTSMLPTMYNINNQWFYKNPHFIPSITPKTIHPEKLQYTFQFLNHTTSGIYSQDNLLNRTKFINLHAEKRQQIEGIVNMLQPIKENHQSYSIDQLFENSLVKLISKSAQFSNNFIVTLGSYMGLIMGFIYSIHLLSTLIFFLIKYRKDTTNLGQQTNHHLYDLPQDG